MVLVLIYYLIIEINPIFLLIFSRYVRYVISNLNVSQASLQDIEYNFLPFRDLLSMDRLILKFFFFWGGWKITKLDLIIFKESLLAGWVQHLSLIQLPTPETHGETGFVHPKRSQKATLKFEFFCFTCWSAAFWDCFAWTDPVSPRVSGVGNLSKTFSSIK